MLWRRGALASPALRAPAPTLTPETVRKGSVLAQIDPRLLQAQLDHARGNVARDRAQLQKAQADQKRYADMLGKGFVSRADYDLYQANLAVAKATPLLKATPPK